MPERMCVIGIAAAALVSSTALAQTAERPEIRVGDQWQFVVWYSAPSTQPNRSWTVAAVTADAIEGAENGEPLRLTRELNVLESPRDRSSNYRLLAFPLAVGKQWKFESDWHFKPKGSSGKSAGSVTVVAYEKVAVPAGEFEAFKLTSSEALSGNSPIGSIYEGTTTRTYWYAPAARAIVKLVSHNPYLGPSTVELVSFERRP